MAVIASKRFAARAVAAAIVTAAAVCTTALSGTVAIAAQGSDQQEAKARGYFTETPLVTQHARPVRFYSDVLSGKLVLINFVYTDCSDACPLITYKLVQVKKELGDLFGKRVRFVSLSLDPQRDTPAALAQFAKRLGAEHPEWFFLTGSKNNIDLVLKRLGGYTNEISNHSTVLLAGDLSAHRWRKLRPDASPSSIAAQLRLLGEFDRSGADAPLRAGAQRPAAKH